MIVTVTATTDLQRFLRWRATNTPSNYVVVWQGTEVPDQLKEAVELDSFSGEVYLVHLPTYAGTVPAFAAGIRKADAEIPYAVAYACLHDDCLMQDARWIPKVEQHFLRHTSCGLLGFGGAAQLGEDDAATAPYRPELLVRKDFQSNMQDAEAHGRRVTSPRCVAVLDGFSLIVRRDLALGLWRHLEQDLALVHHAYDAAAALYVHAQGKRVWLLPLSCHHLGGQTAVGDAGYQTWALDQHPDGDQGFWLQAHRSVWDRYHQELPIRVPPPPYDALDPMRAHRVTRTIVIEGRPEWVAQIYAQSLVTAGVDDEYIAGDRGSVRCQSETWEEVEP